MGAIGFIGVFLSLALLIFLSMKGWNILLVAILATVVLIVTNALNPYEAIFEQYMSGYGAFIQTNFPLFVVGAIFGKIMEVSGAASSVANLIVSKVGASKTIIAVVISCAVLAYGGVSAYVLVFTMYPISVSLFKEADIPRKFLPGALAFGTVTFAMTSPGTPQIQNIIPTQALGTDAMAGTVVGIICGLFMFIVGTIMLKRMVDKSMANGEGFVATKREEDLEEIDESRLPNAIIGLLPLLLTIVLLNIFKIKVEVSILAGIILGLIVFAPNLDFSNIVYHMGESCKGAINAITTTCAVVAFGGVMKSTPSFAKLVDILVAIPGPPLIGAAVAVTVMAGVCGSATGGVSISMPIVGPIYTAMGVSAEHLHRVAAIASGGLDSLPHNGYIVTLLNYCGVSHKEGYRPIFWLTVVLPFITTALSIILFTIFPNLP